MSFGFGSTNNNTSNSFGGFGSSNTGGGFGANNASSGGSLFGGNTATSGGFGGFGSTNNNTSSPFGGGAKPAFGAAAPTSSGGMFGNNANTSTSGGFGTGGGFGASANTSAFGNNAGGGLFGQNKPATGGFGSTNTGGSLFGGGSTGGGFGVPNTNNANPFSTSTNTSTGFGASNNNSGGGFTFGGAANTATNNNGTAGTPFQAFTEKDQGATTSSAYQSITFQQPYQNKSFEELRTEDYAQGRRFGNTNGQAGGFGQSTGFGGFGANNNTNTSTGGGMFGSNTATSGSTGFGQSTGGFGASNTGGFGASNNTGGGLFGANKPATGMFGNNTTGASTGGFGATTNNTGGGLFGGGSIGGFGGNTTQNNTGGGLFGSNNNQQQQNKPAFGGFGASTNTGTGFGGSTNTGGGLFGGSSTQNNTGGGLFGQNNQQQQQSQQSNPFGGSTSNTGGGLFGNQNQNKPATGLFGGAPNSNTGGGLFGSQNNQQQSNPFGGSTNTGGGLFGNQNQNKPAGGLFGNAASTTSTGGGLFGGQNTQQNNNTSLFGNSNTNTGGSLFGNQNKPAGSLFGNSNTNTGSGNTGGLSLFGGNNQSQQNNSNSMFGSSLGQSQNQNNTNSNSLFGSLGQNGQQATSQQNTLHASLTAAPYGNEQLFASLGAPSPPIGPLATPLAGAKPAPRKTPSLLASARFNTPTYSPRGTVTGRPGYGFSYSTYGTPGSAYTSGSLTPGASSLLRPTGSLGSALTSRLNKSLSTSNLRGDGTPGEGRSLLRPSAFSPDGTPGRFQSGSMRKLKIDRSLRTDLFGASEQPKAIEAAKEADGHSLRKQVSFDNGSNQQSNAQPSSSNALVRTEEQDESPAASLAASSKGPQQPEMEQVNGSGLTTVPEDREAPRPSSAPGTQVPAEKTMKSTEVGDYWTKPALKDLKNMSRQQLKNVGNFTVGRQGVGRIEFGSVDLTNTPLDEICGGVVRLLTRSATVYKDDHNKPEVGKALNVPSTIHLEQSWPRAHGGKTAVSAKSGKAYDKHIARLRRVEGTHFKGYDVDSGIWTFKVDHFTTYALDDDEDESEYPEESSALSEPPTTPGQQQDLTMQSMETATGEMDDTFQFKLNKRSQLNVPGGFGDEDATYDYIEQSEDEPMEEDEHMMSGGLGEQDDPFTSSGGAVQAPSPGAIDRYHSSMMDEDQLEAAVEEAEQDLPGAFILEPQPPKSILKPSTGLEAFMSPEKFATESWEEQLQRTMSPRKRDRQALKVMQQSLFQATVGGAEESPFKMSMLGRSALDQSYLAQWSAKKSKNAEKTVGKQSLGESQAFRTSMDVMKSLFNDDDRMGKKATAGGRAFENPYPKRRRLSLQSTDERYLHCLRPTIANDNLLMFAVPPAAPPVAGELAPSKLEPIVDREKQIRFARTNVPDDIHTKTLEWQQEVTTISGASGFPSANTTSDFSFASLAERVQPGLAIAAREKVIWRLSSILFDPVELACPTFLTSVPQEQIEELEPRVRMDALGEFWAGLVESDVQESIKRAKTLEEKALAYLTRNDIVAACEILMGARDFKLAALVSQLPGSLASRAMMKKQIQVWVTRNDWSEMSEAVRALYSLLAGEVCVVAGKAGAAENRVAEFNFRTKFELTWQQSFALRLYFGGHESVGEVVQAYSADLKSTREPLLPTRDWPDLVETWDTLMEVLQLATGTRADGLGMLNAKAVSGAYFNTRLAWQLGILFHARGICTLANDALATLSLSFASELESSGTHLVAAAWVLLHIPSPDSRARAIDALLFRNGSTISEPKSTGDTFDLLHNTLHIPVQPLWKAKALHAQAVLRDPKLQTHYLVFADLLDEAHDVLLTTLGPRAVIEEDYGSLQNVLWPSPIRNAKRWEEGGQVYMDFLALVRERGSGREVDDGMVRRLRIGIGRMGGRSLEERVAVVEMGRVVDEVMREEGEEKVVEGGIRREIKRGEGMLGRYQRAMGIVR